MLRYFKSEMVTASITRYPEGAYVAGEWTPGAETTSSIEIIAPQPVKSNELDPLPEGEKVSNYRKTWSEDPLFTRNGFEDSDRITLGGKTYQVYRVDDRATLGNFHRAVMREVL